LRLVACQLAVRGALPVQDCVASTDVSSNTTVCTSQGFFRTFVRITRITAGNGARAMGHRAVAGGSHAVGNHLVKEG
jgi:hypothetical protein